MKGGLICRATPSLRGYIESCPVPPITLKKKRFCAANGIENLTVLSDYQHREFAQSYGILIKELALLTRAVFVVNAEGKLSYQEIVAEVTDHPDYDAALAAV